MEILTSEAVSRSRQGLDLTEQSVMGVGGTELHSTGGRTRGPYLLFVVCSQINPFTSLSLSLLVDKRDLNS